MLIFFKHIYSSSCVVWDRFQAIWGHSGVSGGIRGHPGASARIGAGIPLRALVGALGLSNGGLELVKFEPGSCQVEAWNLPTLSCAWFAPMSLRHALPWPALSVSRSTNPRLPRARARFSWSMRVVKVACCRASGVDVRFPRAGARSCSQTIVFLEPEHFGRGGRGGTC